MKTTIRNIWLKTGRLNPDHIRLLLVLLALILFVLGAGAPGAGGGFGLGAHSLVIGY